MWGAQRAQQSPSQNHPIEESLKHIFDQALAQQARAATIASELALAEKILPDFDKYKDDIIKLAGSKEHRHNDSNPLFVWKAYCVAKYGTGSLDEILGL